MARMAPKWVSHQLSVNLAKLISYQQPENTWLTCVRRWDGSMRYTNAWTYKHEAFRARAPHLALWASKCRKTWCGLPMWQVIV